MYWWTENSGGIFNPSEGGTHLWIYSTLWDRMARLFVNLNWRQYQCNHIFWSRECVRLLNIRHVLTCGSEFTHFLFLWSSSFSIMGLIWHFRAGSLTCVRQQRLGTNQKTLNEPYNERWQGIKSLWESPEFVTWRHFLYEYLTLEYLSSPLTSIIEYSHSENPWP